jgi:hypothetical protein
MFVFMTVDRNVAAGIATRVDVHLDH